MIRPPFQQVHTPLPVSDSPAKILCETFSPIPNSPCAVSDSMRKIQSRRSRPRRYNNLSTSRLLQPKIFEFETSAEIVLLNFNDFKENWKMIAP
nr:hypothetical protein Iba_chr11eCG10480 [Ipomoea batatas]